MPSQGQLTNLRWFFLGSLVRISGLIWLLFHSLQGLDNHLRISLSSVLVILFVYVFSWVLLILLVSFHICRWLKLSTNPLYVTIANSGPVQSALV